MFFCIRIKLLTLARYLQAYELLLPLADNPASLDKTALCRIHAALMKTCRFVDTYTPLGMTRSATRKTVFVAGTYNIQCCPFNQVDAELDRICNLAKVRTALAAQPSVDIADLSMTFSVAMEPNVAEPIRHGELAPPGARQMPPLRGTSSHASQLPLLADKNLLSHRMGTGA
jgi:hypothetical protein